MARPVIRVSPSQLEEFEILVAANRCKVVRSGPRKPNGKRGNGDLRYTCLRHDTMKCDTAKAMSKEE